MSRYQVAVPAQLDLDEICSYIAEGSIEAARRWLTQIEAHCERLAEMPGMGRRREELAPDLRSFPVEAYLIFYRQTDQGIEVLRVLHGSRDVESLFRD